MTQDSQKNQENEQFWHCNGCGETIDHYDDHCPNGCNAPITQEPLNPS